MILPWNYKEILENFLKEKTQVLSFSFLYNDLLLKINHNPNLITVITENENLMYKNAGISCFLGVNSLKKASFDIVLSQFKEYNIKDIHSLLKKGGHFLTEQKAYTKALNYNLENEVELLKKTGFKIVKCNQTYIKDENYFYVLAKKIN